MTWPYDASANRYTKTFMKDFFDLSGEMHVRTGDIRIHDGSLNIQGQTLHVENNKFVIDDLSINNNIYAAQLGIGSNIEVSGNILSGGVLGIGATNAVIALNIEKDATTAHLQIKPVTDDNNAVMIMEGQYTGTNARQQGVTQMRFKNKSGTIGSIDGYKQLGYENRGGMIFNTYDTDTNNAANATLVLDSSHNVGIGTTNWNDAHKLHVEGTLNVSNGIVGTLQTAAQPNITSLGTLTSLTTSGATNLNGSTHINGTGVLTLNNTAASSNEGGELILNDGTNATDSKQWFIDNYYNSTSALLRIRHDNWTNSMVFDEANKRIGINKSNPSQMLDISGNVRIDDGTSGEGNQGAKLIFGDAYGAAGPNKIQLQSSGYGFGVDANLFKHLAGSTTHRWYYGASTDDNGTTAMTLENSTLGINLNSPTTSYKLDVSGTSQFRDNVDVNGITFHNEGYSASSPIYYHSLSTGSLPTDWTKSANASVLPNRLKLSGGTSITTDVINLSEHVFFTDDVGNGSSNNYISTSSRILLKVMGTSYMQDVASEKMRIELLDSTDNSVIDTIYREYTRSGSRVFNPIICDLKPYIKYGRSSFKIKFVQPVVSGGSQDYFEFKQFTICKDDSSPWYKNSVYKQQILGGLSIGTGDYIGRNLSSQELIVQGNVGIGTTNPSEKLDVSGNIKATGNLTLRNPTGGELKMDFIRTNGSNNKTDWQLHSNSGLFSFNANTVGGGTILQLGNKYDGATGALAVGGAIHTTGPTLQVLGDASINSHLTVHGDLKVNGNINFDGDVIQTNTLIKFTESIDVSNSGTQPALRVNQVGTDDNFAVAEFLHNDVIAMSIRGDSGYGGDVSMNHRLSVAGDASFGNMYIAGNLIAPNLALGQLYIDTITMTPSNANDHSIAIGKDAGLTDQSYNSIAIGSYAGETNQEEYSIAIGYQAGKTDQSSNSIAMGYQAGKANQGVYAIAMGYQAAMTSQGNKAIAMGQESGNANQGPQAIAMGWKAAMTSQGEYSIAMGTYAGFENQGNQCIAMGYNTGRKDQENRTIAMGFQAGWNDQSNNSIAMGTDAGYNNQGAFSVAMGFQAGQHSQAYSSIAIGDKAGKTNQSHTSIAIGLRAGHNNQGRKDGTGYGPGAALAIGYDAGYDNQAYRSIAMGLEAGYNNQRHTSIAIGYQAGYTSQARNCLALGLRAGYTGQSDNCTAVGFDAGYTNQGTHSVAMGYQAGYTSQSANCLAIGLRAGYIDQSDNCIAVGFDAGHTNQDEYSVAMGFRAGYIDQHANTIILNAQGSPLNSTSTNSVYIKPVRQSDKPILSGVDVTNIQNSAHHLNYDISSGEVSYSRDIDISLGAINLWDSSLNIWGSDGGPSPNSSSTNTAPIYFKARNVTDDWTMASIAGYHDNSTIGGGLAFNTKLGDGNAATAVTTAMVIDASGHVGIGHTLPSKTLDVGGTAVISKHIDNHTDSIHTVLKLNQEVVTDTYTNGRPVLTLDWAAETGTHNSNTDSKKWSFGQGGVTEVTGGGASSTLGLGYASNGTFGWAPQFYFDGSGRLGIGTNAPTEKLEVYGNIRINNGKTTVNEQGGTLIFDNAHGKPGPNKIVVHSAGYGFGVDQNTLKYNSDKGHKFYVGSGAATNGNLALQILDNTDVSMNGAVINGDVSMNSGASILGGAYITGDIGNMNGTKTPPGVYLGATSHMSGSQYAMMQMVSNNGNGGWIDWTDDGGDGDFEGRIRYSTAVSTDHHNAGFNFYTDEIHRMNIDTSGNVGIGMTTPAATLDITSPNTFGTSTHKPVINTLTGNKFSTIQGDSFTWITLQNNAWNGGSSQTPLSGYSTNDLFDQLSINAINYFNADNANTTGQFGIDGRVKTGMGFSTRNNATVNENALAIDYRGYVGIGITSPTETLDVSGNINATNIIIANDSSFNADLYIAGNLYIAGDLSATYIQGTLTTASQPNITTMAGLTSVGTLSSLTVTADIDGSVTGFAATVTDGAQPEITSVGRLTQLEVLGDLSATNIQGTLTTVSQPNITSVGPLNGGSITSGFGSINVGTSLIQGGAITGTSLSAGTATGEITGKLVSANQSNITTVGTLTGLSVNATDDVTITALNKHILLQSNGSNVGIGTSTPAEKLHIVGSMQCEGDIYLKGESVNRQIIFAKNTDNTINGGIKYDNTNPASMFLYSDRYFRFLESDNSTEIFTIDGNNGRVGINNNNPSQALDVFGNIIATGTISSSSDVKLKTNIKPLEKALEKINKLQGVSYNRIDLEDTESTHIGLIAQELEQVYPEIVSESKTGKRVAYGNMIAPLIEAIKELSVKVDKLATENTELKERVFVLEQK